MTDTKAMPVGVSELLPCPFCGMHLTIRGGVNGYGRCETADCWVNARAITVPSDDPTQVAAWNTRSRLSTIEAGPGEPTEARVDTTGFVRISSHDMTLILSGYEAALGWMIRTEPALSEAQKGFDLARAALSPIGGEAEPVAVTDADLRQWLGLLGDIAIGEEPDEALEAITVKITAALAAPQGGVK